MGFIWDAAFNRSFYNIAFLREHFTTGEELLFLLGCFWSGLAAVYTCTSCTTGCFQCSELVRCGGLCYCRPMHWCFD